MTVFGATLLAGRSQAQAAESATWQPTRHAEDDWLDQMPGKHRLVFDTISPPGVGSALLFANNYYAANQSGYALGDADNAVVIVMRHTATPFGYNDAMWAKYSAPIAKRAGFEDPKTKQPPIINVYNSTAYAALLPSRNNTLASLTKRGVQLAVCQMATRAYAGSIAEATGGNADSIFKELAANLLPNARLVPAGIVAINRAQERGYALAHGG
jgi:intracellular sulfur oxidation DsrE/DsrF family protein